MAFSRGVCPLNDRPASRPWIRRVLILISGLFLFALDGCSARDGAARLQGEAFGHYADKPGLQVAAAFGPDGRLWRLVPTREHVYVDYSTDFGKTFNEPVAVNSEGQHIQAKDEDRPQIAVDGSGRIYVLYSAYSALPWTAWLSASDDGGKGFIKPVTISEKANEARHYQSKLAVSPSGKLYVFWHDDRDHPEGSQGAGNALYVATPESGGDLGHLPNRKVADEQCECCRIAVAFDTAGSPVLLTRFVYPGNIRDHGIVKPGSDRARASIWRVTFDDWKIEACPEQGPAIAIGADGRYHIAWFSQGSVRQGLFYAHSDDQGRTFEKPLPFGESERLAGHPDVIVLGQRVVLAWQEFDGSETQVRAMESRDGGRSWLPTRTLARTASEADYPFLLSDGERLFLSWNTQTEGYRLIPIE